MYDLADNLFYPPAERIWLCTRLNNAGRYCDIILQNHSNVENECENCVRILEEEKHRQSAPYVRYVVKKMKEIGILLDKSKR